MTRDALTADLFAQDPLRPLARRRDPLTSRWAADEAIRSGALGQQLRLTLAALQRHLLHHDPPTSAELAGGDLRLRYQYARRLADLEDRGLVRKVGVRTCRQTGRQAVTWGVVKTVSGDLVAEMRTAAFLSECGDGRRDQT